MSVPSKSQTVFTISALQKKKATFGTITKPTAQSYLHLITKKRSSKPQLKADALS